MYSVPKMSTDSEISEDSFITADGGSSERKIHCEINWRRPSDHVCFDSTASFFSLSLRSPILSLFFGWLAFLPVKQHRSIHTHICMLWCESERFVCICHIQNTNTLFVLTKYFFLGLLSINFGILVDTLPPPAPTQTHTHKLKPEVCTAHGIPKPQIAKKNTQREREREKEMSRKYVNLKRHTQCSSSYTFIYVLATCINNISFGDDLFLLYIFLFFYFFFFFILRLHIETLYYFFILPI